MFQASFFRNAATRTLVGFVAALFALASIMAAFPAQFAHAETISGLITTGYAEDGSKTTLQTGDQFIIHFDYTASYDDLLVDPAGTCTINTKDVKNTLQSFGDGNFQIVYTVADGDPAAAAGQIPFHCDLKDTAEKTITLTSFSGGENVAIGGATNGGDTNGGNNNGGNNGELPPPGTFAVTVEPSTGTVNVGGQVTILVNDTGGVTDFAVDPAGACTVNGKDVAPSFQSFGDHRYQMVYTVAEGDPNVAAGQLAVSCAVKNPSGTAATINTIAENTLAINGTTNTGGNNNGGTAVDVGNATVTISPTSGTLGVGGVVEIHIQHNDNLTDLTQAQACTFNGNHATNSWEHLGNGHYKVIHTVSAGDADVAAGQITFTCTIKNGAGQTATLTLAQANTLAIDVPENNNNGGNNNGGNNNGGDNDTDSETDGTIDGDVNGGVDNGVLAVTQIDQVRGTAVADGTMENGWKWVFHITVPTNEPNVSLKFGNWAHSNGVNSISPAHNMRFASPQAGSAAPVIITGAGTYTAPIVVIGDLNPSVPGRQIQVTVEMGVPVGSANGSYATTYHVRSTE